MSVRSSELGPPHPFSRKRVCPPPAEPKLEGTHSPAGEGVEGPNSDDWRKSLVLCLLYGHCTMPFPVLITNCHLLFLQPSHTVHICRYSTVFVLVQCMYIYSSLPSSQVPVTHPAIQTRSHHKGGGEEGETN